MRADRKAHSTWVHLMHHPEEGGNRPRNSSGIKGIGIVPMEEGEMLERRRWEKAAQPGRF